MYSSIITVAVRDASKLHDVHTDRNYKNRIKVLCTNVVMVDDDTTDDYIDALESNGIEIIKKEFNY